MKELVASLERELNEKDAKNKAQEMYVNALMPLKARNDKLEAERQRLFHENANLKVNYLQKFNVRAVL